MLQKNTKSISCSKINKLNSLPDRRGNASFLLLNTIKSIQMKKTAYLSIVIIAVAVSVVACRKQYHCHCMYNNKLVYSQDLGNKTKADAEKLCSRNDTLVAGEVWTCTTY